MPLLHIVEPVSVVGGAVVAGTGSREIGVGGTVAGSTRPRGFESCFLSLMTSGAASASSLIGNFVLIVDKKKEPSLKTPSLKTLS